MDNNVLLFEWEIESIFSVYIRVWSVAIGYMLVTIAAKYSKNGFVCNLLEHRNDEKYLLECDIFCCPPTMWYLVYNL